MSLYGKGFYIWQIPKCDGGDPAAIAARAKAANLSHVLIKIADGPAWPYNYDFERKVDLVPPVARALKDIGVEVWGWHYVLGDKPVDEARLAVQRMRDLDLAGYVIDAEGEYRTLKKAAAAESYMTELRSGLGDTPIALSTYRFPKYHLDFPFDSFMKQCDYAMPQVYFQEAHNPAEQLERSVEQYMSLRYARPVIPTAPAYSSPTWRPTPEELQAFFQKAKDMKLAAANAWSWDYSTQKEYLDLWNAIADFQWEASPPVADMPERLVGRLNQRDPVFVGGLYQENAAHVTGDRTLVGREAIREWYAAFLAEQLPDATFKVTSKSGTGSSRHYTWTAESTRGNVLDGNDTLGIKDGRIQYHYTYFTIQSN